MGEAEGGASGAVSRSGMLLMCFCFLARRRSSPYLDREKTSAPNGGATGAAVFVVSKDSASDRDWILIAIGRVP